MQERAGVVPSGSSCFRVRRDHLSSSEAALIVLQYQVIHETSGLKAVDLDACGDGSSRGREPWLWGWSVGVASGLDRIRGRMYAGWIPTIALMDVWLGEEIRRTERVLAAVEMGLRAKIEGLVREHDQTEARLLTRRAALVDRVKTVARERAATRAERKNWKAIRLNLVRTDAYQRELMAVCEEFDRRRLRPLAT